MTAILKKDSTLLREYEEESRRGSGVVMVDYIQKYNKLHSDEADLDKIVPIQVFLYRRSKKEKEQSFTILTRDSLDYPMEVNSFYKIETLSDTIALCLNGKCKDIPLAEKKPNYIYAYWKTNETEPGLELVDVKEGEFYFKEVQYRHTRKEEE